MHIVYIDIHTLCLFYSLGSYCIQGLGASLHSPMCIQWQYYRTKEKTYHSQPDSDWQRLPEKAKLQKPVAFWKNNRVFAKFRVTEHCISIGVWADDIVFKGGIVLFTKIKMAKICEYAISITFWWWNIFSYALNFHYRFFTW